MPCRARISGDARRCPFGAASESIPKFVSPSDPAAQWTGALKGHAFFAYATNYVIDLDHAIVLDVEATRAIRQAEVGAARTMLDRVEKRFGLYPEKLAADRAYGSAEMLGWLVHERGIEPHIPVFDKPTRPLPRERSFAPSVRDGARALHRRRFCRWRRLRGSMPA